ncbi:MAG: hypothetical protein IT165_29225 [Bryobacterales bacterium]|nr:hypothetical protein [Bryobacterales bacterium]
MVVLTFKTQDDCEREVEFDGREEAIARMHDIPYNVLEYAHVHDEGGDLVAER